VVALMYFRIPFGATLCFLVYLVAALSDWLDGYLARRCDLVSTFGKFMDALTDKIFMIGLFVAILVMGLLPRWALFLVLLIIGREFLVTGLRLVASSHSIVIVAERAGKIKTVMQIIAIGFFILWRMITQDLTFLPVWFGQLIYGIALFLFLISTYLTISSGCYYFRRYYYLFDYNAKGKD
jgi:CDP-diacylglycerol--glycerol-3-phosphate 3-phosphatidyltransferase